LTRRLKDMGTNFYLKEDESFHIGKRSAAGWYCWNCGITLCKGGEEQIHYGKGMEDGWWQSCPECDQEREQESTSESSVGRELGFNKSDPCRKTGVKSCSSFSWAMKPNKLTDLIEYMFDALKVSPDTTVILDEYGNEFTWERFKEVLSECPVQFYHSIGKEFW
jgi:hypothetical protein